MRGQPDPLREPHAAAVRASPTHRPDVTRIVMVALAVALFLAVAGAFGTGSKPFVLRLGFWVLSIGIGASVGATLATLFHRAGWLHGPTWRDVGLLTLAISAPLIVITWALTAMVFHQPLTLETLLEIAAPVMVVTLAITLLNILTARGRGGVGPAAAASEPPLSPAGLRPRPRLLERLPPRLRGADLIALEAEDHYLRLHTTLGSDLILMRLADAVAEAEGIEGAQTHRSWWVARDAVVDAVRGDGRATLKLKGGLEAPVSRTFAPALREARWF